MIKTNLGRVLTGRSEVPGVAVVGLKGTEEPVDRRLVVIVFLALDNNLLQAIDELVAAFLGELFTEHLAGPIDLLVGAILVLLWDTVTDAHDLVTETLRKQSQKEQMIEKRNNIPSWRHHPSPHRGHPRRGLEHLVDEHHPRPWPVPSSRELPA